VSQRPRGYPVRLIGNSLTPEEYRAAIIAWVRRNGITATGTWGERLKTPEDSADDLVKAIESGEAQRMVKRFGAGEEWPDIKASSQGPPHP